MVRIIGISNPMAFDTKDGTHIEGVSIYLANPIDPKKGKGEEGEKIFLSTARLTALSFRPEIGQVLEVFYNKFGKVATLKLIDEEIKFDK